MKGIKRMAGMYKKIVLIAVLMVGGCGITKYKKVKHVRYEMEIQDDSTICGHSHRRNNK